MTMGRTCGAGAASLGAAPYMRRVTPWLTTLAALLLWTIRLFFHTALTREAA